MNGRSELSEALAARIVDHISAEKLAAGTHIAAQDLADRFSVSRSPINQALRLLHEKGILAHERNRGYLVGEAGEVSGVDLGLPTKPSSTGSTCRLRTTARTGGCRPRSPSR